MSFMVLFLRTVLLTFVPEAGASFSAAKKLFSVHVSCTCLCLGSKRQMFCVTVAVISIICVFNEDYWLLTVIYMALGQSCEIKHNYIGSRRHGFVFSIPD